MGELGVNGWEKANVMGRFSVFGGGGENTGGVVQECLHLHRATGTPKCVVWQQPPTSSIYSSGTL